MNNKGLSRIRGWIGCALLLLGCWLPGARGEAMLELFQMRWADLTQKMPELAEAGYTSLWLPQPAKGGGVLSVGYDLYDPFDLGDKNQNGTVATKYGTKADLLLMVETAHRFGIRVYFDNVMNHRQGRVPGDPYTATNFFPGLLPKDFHLQTGVIYNTNWPDVQNWNDQGYVQNEPINGLVDLANEPGPINFNYGRTLFSQTNKLSFVRQPTNTDYYMDTNTVLLGSWPAGSSPGFSWPAGAWHGFNGTNGQPVAERVEDYLTRAAMWTLYMTKCDGFRLDAVKHTPSPFFGDSSSSWRGYVGGIQAAYDFTHGYGSNVLGNGYYETNDDMRNSCFDTETPRNDAMLFGEHLGPPPSYSEYIATGMRLLNSPLRDTLNGALGGNGSLPSGMDQRDYTPSGGFTATTGVQFAEDQDHILCCPTHREMQDAYYFTHEGLPMIYSDNFNWAGDPNNGNTFPEVPKTDYLGQGGDNTMPETCYLHHQLSRGGTRSRWSDSHVVAFERYDYRDGVSGDPYTNADATVVLFVMNATYNTPSGDVAFDDNITRISDNYYTNYNGAPKKGNGMLVGFPPGSVLSQMASSSPGSDRATKKLLVHFATTDINQARTTGTNTSITDPTQRLIYVNTTPPPGGGAVEMIIPAGGWVMYGYQWPEASRASLKDAITFRQGGADAPRVTIYRHDGSNGDTNFNPVYPFKMRGSINPDGSVIGGVHVSNLTYAIDVPVLTNAPFDIAARCDASAANVQMKMDGGLDLNSQMGLAPTTGFDRRDNRPGYASDVFLGYEQAVSQFRYGPEKFGARDISRDNVVSLGAETYYYIVGGTNTVVNGSGGGLNLTTQAANWVYHDPAATNSAFKPDNAPTQRVPLSPTNGQLVDIWAKVGYGFHFATNHCTVYYTTDGSNPEGSFGIPKPGTTTHAVAGAWMTNDTQDTASDWFKATIAASNQVTGVQVRYKVAFYADNIPTISDADDSKLYGLTQFGITNFNPTTATVWLHNDLNTNNTTTGLRPGFHIVRTRSFLPRSGKSGVYNTFLQTFYYSAQLPTGVIAYPTTDGSSITSPSYTVDVMADSSVAEVDYCITDSNGQTCGVATPVTPDPTLAAQYPNFPQEYQFVYSPVASSGTATITVQLKDFAATVYPNRYTTLTRTVNALAPASVVRVASPSPDGTVLLLSANGSYTIQGCLSTNLSTSTTFYSLYINNILQPRANYLIRAPGSVAGCPGMRSFLYVWNTPISGTNVLQLIYTNGITLTDTRTVAVARVGDTTDSDGDGVPDWMEILAGTNPYDATSFLRITALTPGNPVAVTWSSVPSKLYQVLSTTNWAYPMTPIPGVQVYGDANTNVTQWLDYSVDAVNKFYRVQVLY